MPNFWVIKISRRTTRAGYARTITNLQIVLNTPKNPYLNQATQTNTCQNFPTTQNTEIENFKPPKNLSIIPVTWNLEYPPPPGLHSWFINSSLIINSVSIYNEIVRQLLYNRATTACLHSLWISTNQETLVGLDRYSTFIALATINGISRFWPHKYILCSINSNSFRIERWGIFGDSID